LEQKQRRAVLFPIRLDDAVMDTGEAWAADIELTRHIGDSRQQGLPGPCRDASGAFREWKSHDKYKEAFGRLIRDLKAGEGRKN
jgi:hypothetical protein